MANEHTKSGEVGIAVYVDFENLAEHLRAGFEELLALVKETYEREYAGEKFGTEEADAIGNEAQDIADRIVAMVLQAAAKNGVTLKM